MTTGNGYELNCLIEGEEDTLIISVSRAANIKELKKVIHQEGELDALQYRLLDLALWKVDIDIGPLRGRISEFKFEDHQGVRLDVSSDTLSDLWEEQPSGRHLHIFVKVRGRGGKPATLPPSFQDTHLASISAAQSAPAPSNVANNVATYKEEQVKHPIYNGRPIELHGPPVEIYDETLAKLKHELIDLSNAPEPSADYIVQTANLFHASAPIYNSEPLRTKAVYGLLKWLLAADIRLSVKASEDKSNRLITEGDGAICETLEDVSLGKKTAVVAYLELKNELGLRGEAGLQAALSLRKHISQKNYEEIRNVSCCPSILISLAGPFLHISASTFVEVFTVQPFTDYIYLGGNPFEIKQIKYVAKVFEAVARAVKSLRGYYYDLRVREHPEFRSPSPTYLPNSPLIGDLEFISRVLFEEKANYRRSLFYANYNGKPVLVKFCETYGESAHRILAAEGLAPAIHYCSQILGGAFMAVMDLVQGRDAYHEFKHRDLPPTVLEDVQLGLKTLHDAGLVFGDVRRPNIMVVKTRNQHGDDEWHARLVDFDWSGPVGDAKYPPTLNKDIRWARGVEAAHGIEKQHDLDMLERLRLGTDE